MRQRLIIGLMSGTSVDGIDAALVRVRGRAPRLKAEVLMHVARRWPAALRRRILAAMAPASPGTAEICALHGLLAREFAGAALACAAAAGVKPEQITAIGSHGQTVCHLPPMRKGRVVPRPSSARRRSADEGVGTTLGTPLGTTLQLGDVSMVAALTGIPTVGDFRPADMALGGQGAPLVPWTDAVLLRDPRRTRCVQNIGGIGNVTYLPRGSRVNFDDVVAFDTGPGNMLIDAAVRLLTDGKAQFDRNGRLAARGRLHYPLFRRVQALEYFSQAPPKSTGRECFGVPLAVQLRQEFPHVAAADFVHTLTYVTAWSIADAYVHFLPALPEEVILCGGGVENLTLVSLLQAELARLRPPAEIVIRRIDDVGIPNKAKEAASFAMLAAATLDGVPANLPQVTGAARSAVLGVVATPGAKPMPAAGRLRRSGRR